MTFTRRDIGKLALCAIPGAQLLAKPDSKFDGVQIGLNVPYSFGRSNMSITADEILDRTVKLGLSAVELRAQPVEAFLGAPSLTPMFNSPLPAATPEEQAQRRVRAEELRKWRLALSVDGFKAFRRKYEQAGVLVDVLKVDRIDAMTDDELDYCFVMAKTLGSRAISCEPPLSASKRLGQFADKHKLMIGYHGHTDITSPEAFGKPASWEQAMSYAKYNGINLDLGHFVSGNNTSPIPFLTKYHDRITHLHVKDRKLNNGPATAFGQGDTPIKETLRLMRDKKWTFQASIEFEYPVPPGGDQMTEIGKTIEYCRKALS